MAEVSGSTVPESEVVLGYGPRPTYQDEEARTRLTRIVRAADVLFEQADELNRHSLPGGLSFANHNLAPLGDDGHQLFELERFFKSFTEDVWRRVMGVRLRLNNYAQDLGIGLVSVAIEPFDDMGGNVALPDTDSAAPTLGNVLPPSRLTEQVLAMFPISRGSAELINGDGTIHARTYSYGENRFGEDRVQEPQRVGSRGGSLLVTEGSKVGVSMPILDPAKFGRANVDYELVDTQRREQQSQIYTCRNLTAAAALNMIRGEI